LVVLTACYCGVLSDTVLSLVKNVLKPNAEEQEEAGKSAAMTDNATAADDSTDAAAAVNDGGDVKQQSVTDAGSANADATTQLNNR